MSCREGEFYVRRHCDIRYNDISTMIVLVSRAIKPYNGSWEHYGIVTRRDGSISFETDNEDRYTVWGDYYARVDDT